MPTRSFAATEERIRDELDSASNYSSIPFHAVYEDLNYTIGQAFVERNGGSVTYTWNFASDQLNMRFYLELKSLYQSDTLLYFDEKGRQIGSMHSDNFNAQWITEPVAGKVYMQLRNHSGRSNQLRIKGRALSLEAKSLSKTFDFGDSQSCQVNVNCSEGNNYQDVKRSIVRILVKVGNYLGWCSGSIVNNTAYDYTPYLLTAEHCGIINSNFVSSGDLNQWVFYFNYEASGCSNPNSENDVNFSQLTGATLISRSDDDGGETGSDFLLLRLNNSIPASFNVYYAGWNRSSSSPQKGVCMHHPNGDIKKISTFNFPASSAAFGSNASNTHWSVNWFSTANGFGVTEGGSSGSPLLDANGLIVGQLTGGGASCTFPNSNDFFGKFDYNWTQNGSSSTNRLRDWLDPLNLGNQALGGSNLGDSIPTDTSDLIITPIPAFEGFIELRALGSITDNIEVQLIDLSGKMVFDNSFVALPGVAQRVDVSALRSGMYIVRVIRNGNPITRKIVIENQ